MGPLVALLGTWTGRGRGEYPTIAPFDYDETIEITHVGKPYFSYGQTTTSVADGRRLHGERGFWRMAGPSAVELVVAHPNGIVEVAEGTLDGTTVHLRSTVVARTAMAKDVTRIDRDFVIDGDGLRYSLRMSAVGRELSPHLTAELRRIG
jgi:hypothetical protein